MPSSEDYKRDYRQEYLTSHSSEKAKKKRAQNNAARRKMEKAGKVRKGDGKDVAHKNNKTSDNSTSNLSVQSPSKNRSFARDKNARRKK
jgi:lipopolysaccharide export LptBFGC system permease protein LptF